MQTHAAFARWIKPGFRVLEVGCGTGVDTAFLAAMGAKVVACDPSDEMLSRTKRRLANAGLGDRAGILSCGLQELPQFLDALDHAEGFDAVVSNFGALNCVPSLDALGVIGRRHLRPGGAMILGLIGRTCLWETVYFTARGDALDRRRDGASRTSRCPWPALTCRPSIIVAATCTPAWVKASRSTARSALASWCRRRISSRAGNSCRSSFAAPRPASIASPRPGRS